MTGALRLVAKRLLRMHDPVRFEPAMGVEFQNLHRKCKDLTMTSIERMYALYNATRYVTESGVPGAIVECGVWRGGSAMLCALTLQTLKESSRRIYLYDTFQGMAEPTDRDIHLLTEERASTRWDRTRRESFTDWCYSPLSEVKENLFSTGYPRHNLIFVEGKVEETIPRLVPDKIAILRLDTDWYESTLHELTHLYPLVSRGGVLIIDDYGHWKGSKDATDTFFSQSRSKILLHRIDYAGRIGIKLE